MIRVPVEKEESSLLFMNFVVWSFSFVCFFSGKMDVTGDHSFEFSDGDYKDAGCKL